MKFYGYKTAFVATMLSFGLFVWAWKCFIIKPNAQIVSTHVVSIGNFAMKSNFDNIILSVLVGFILPIVIIVSTKVLLTIKYNRTKSKKTEN